MATFTPLTEADVRSLFAAYSLGEVVGFRGIPAGSVNSNFAVDTSERSLFLRVYEEQDASGARDEAELLTHLAARGVLTAGPLSRRDGAFVSEMHKKPAAVFPWMAGGMRCQASVSLADARRVGEALGRIHAAGADAKRGAGRFQAADLFTRLERVALCPNADLAAQAGPLERELTAWSARRNPDLPRGLVHGDLFRDNVLWSDDGQISALLDFESASDGVLAYDLMVTVLAWCVGDELDADLGRALVLGYQTVRPLTEAEKNGLCAEGCLAALRFTVTRITDYAMRAGVGPRVMKDWRRFLSRFERMKALDTQGVRSALGV